MRGRRLAVRIVSFAATVRGFAYAVTEGPGCLVDVNVRRQPSKAPDVEKILAAILTRARPLFVAFEATKSKRGTRASVLDEHLTKACAAANIMILRVTAEQLKILTRLEKPTRWDIASAVAKQTPELAHRLPRKRGLWEPEDERVGLFHAVACGLAAWNMFRPPAIDDS